MAGGGGNTHARACPERRDGPVAARRDRRKPVQAKRPEAGARRLRAKKGKTPGTGRREGTGVAPVQDGTRGWIRGSGVFNRGAGSRLSIVPTELHGRRS